MNTPLSRILRGITLALAVFMLPVAAQAEAPAQEEGNQPAVRAMAMEVEAVVTAVDLETRHVTLKGPQGNSFTLTAKEDVVKLEDVKVGDVLRATYLAALEGELREPTEEELAEPWVVLEDGGKGMVDGQPVAGGARLVRAVCTIEGMNRLLGTVTILDPRGKAHVIGDVEPEKMAGVTLGQTIVMVYREALALTLEHVHTAE
jgi:hypothetical protein